MGFFVCHGRLCDVAFSWFAGAGWDQANTGALSGYVGSAEVEETPTLGPGERPNSDALPTVATAEKVNQRNKNTFVWLRAPRTLVLDELLPAALPAPHAATELMPQSAATAGDFAALSASSAATVPMPPSAAPAVVQPASGSDPARLPFASIEPVRGPHPAWLERWIKFEQALAKEAQEWEWVKIEKDEKEEQEIVVNSKPKAEHVTNLATLARLQCLEEENLMFWVFEYGEEEGLMRAIDELHDRLNFECGVGGPLGKESASGPPEGFSAANHKRRSSFSISRSWGWFGFATVGWRLFFDGMVFGFARARLGGRC